MTAFISATLALALVALTIIFTPPDDMTYTTTTEDAEIAPAIKDVRDLDLEISLSPWSEIERLRAELWATRQELNRVRDERNELRDLFRGQSAEQSPIEVWTNGYRTSGAPIEYLDGFVRPGGIIDCESGRPHRPDWVTVVSSTRDVGPAQINMAAHSGSIEDRWPDLDAVSSMQDPWRNGFFAGVLVLGRGDVGDWYRSRSCHGLR